MVMVQKKCLKRVLIQRNSKSWERKKRTRVTIFEASFSPSQWPGPIEEETVIIGYHNGHEEWTVRSAPVSVSVTSASGGGGGDGDEEVSHTTRTAANLICCCCCCFCLSATRRRSGNLLTAGCRLLTRAFTWADWRRRLAAVLWLAGTSQSSQCTVFSHDTISI